MTKSMVKRHRAVMSNENSRVSAAIQSRAWCCGMWGTIHSHGLKMHFCHHKALPCPHCFSPHQENTSTFWKDERKDGKKMNLLILHPHIWEHKKRRRRKTRGKQVKQIFGGDKESCQSRMFDHDKHMDEETSTTQKTNTAIDKSPNVCSGSPVYEKTDNGRRRPDRQKRNRKESTMHSKHLRFSLSFFPFTSYWSYAVQKQKHESHLDWETWKTRHYYA